MADLIRRCKCRDGRRWGRRDSPQADLDVDILYAAVRVRGGLPFEADLSNLGGSTELRMPSREPALKVGAASIVVRRRAYGHAIAGGPTEVEPVGGVVCGVATEGRASAVVALVVVHGVVLVPCTVGAADGERVQRAMRTRVGALKGVRLVWTHAKSPRVP